MDKRCIKCDHVKPLSEFHKSKSQKDGYFYYCKACKREIARAEYQRNKETYMAWGKRYRAENADKKREYGKAYREKNREKMLPYFRRYYQANKEKWTESAERNREARSDRDRRRLSDPHRRAYMRRLRRKHFAKNAERYKESKARWEKVNRAKVSAYKRNYKSRKMNAAGQHTGADIIRIWHRQNGHCYWCSIRCGSKPSDTSCYEVDHVTPLSKGGTNHPHNLCIACPPCNSSKKAMYPIEYRRFMLQVST